MTCDTCAYYEFVDGRIGGERLLDRHMCWAEPVSRIRSTGPDIPRACRHHPGLQADLNDSLLASCGERWLIPSRVNS